MAEKIRRKDGEKGLAHEFALFFEIVLWFFKTPLSVQHVTIHFIYQAVAVLVSPLQGRNTRN